MDGQFQEKLVILEANFSERMIYFRSFDTSVLIPDDVWNDSLLGTISPEWHDPDKDEMQFFVFYNDNSYYCQKRRKRFDYENESYYWQSYQSSEKSLEQAQELYDILTTIGSVEKIQEEQKWLDEAKTLVSDNTAYFIEKWSVVKRQINEMLYFSDWRVLPDVVEKFEGERDMWIEWRKRLRQLLPGVDTFESEYNAFKYSFELKYPIDPKQYITKYPNKEVEYLSTEDQFTSYGFRAATDYLTKNVYTIQEYIRNNINNEIIIEQKTRELIQKLRITNYYPDLIEKINANNAEVEELG